MSKKIESVINETVSHKVRYKGDNDMYDTTEFYNEEDLNLKDILKSSLYNFYIQNKEKYLKTISNDLTKQYLEVYNDIA